MNRKTEVKDYNEKVTIRIGKTIKELRLYYEISTETLANEIGVSIQQVQKYEKAINRICPARLMLVARLFNKNINYFFKEDDSVEKTITLDPDFKLNELIKNIKENVEKFNNYKIR